MADPWRAWPQGAASWHGAGRRGVEGRVASFSGWLLLFSRSPQMKADVLVVGARPVHASGRGPDGGHKSVSPSWPQQWGPSGRWRQERTNSVEIIMDLHWVQKIAPRAAPRTATGPRQVKRQGLSAWPHQRKDLMDNEVRSGSGQKGPMADSYTRTTSDRRTPLDWYSRFHRPIHQSFSYVAAQTANRWKCCKVGLQEEAKE